MRMTVEINVNWRFVGDDEDFSLSFSTGPIAARPEARPEADEHERDELREFPYAGSVLPLSSSVLAPGLSMPVATR